MVVENLKYWGGNIEENCLRAFKKYVCPTFHPPLLHYLRSYITLFFKSDYMTT